MLFRSSMFTTAHSCKCSVYSNDYFSVLGFGSQCASADMASSETFDIHRILLQNNIRLLENVGDTSDIPPGGQGNQLLSDDFVIVKSKRKIFIHGRDIRCH